MKVVRWKVHYTMAICFDNVDIVQLLKNVKRIGKSYAKIVITYSHHTGFGKCYCYPETVTCVTRITEDEEYYDMLILSSPLS